MKKGNNRLILMLAFGLAAGWGCASSTEEGDRQPEPVKNPDPERVEITFGTASARFSSGTRALSDFPNGGNIGVVATTELNSNLRETDWTLYEDIDNAEAVAVSESGGVFTFQFTPKKYWPMDGSNLHFMAYSPAPTIESSTTYTLNTGRNGLFIILNDHTPDVLYASNNTSPAAYNKSSGTVELGEFRHALCSLVVQVIAGDQISSTVRVNGLSVETPARTATLFLPSGDDGLEVTQSPDEPYRKVFVNSVTNFINGRVEGSLLLFPGTEGVTQINLSLVDIANNDSFTASYLVPFFQSDVAGQAITLQRSKITTLRILVNQRVVENPNEDVILEGTITDWNDMGDYGISIN